MAPYKMLIAYEGTHYHGWQIQPNGISIQQIIENQLQIILRQEIKITGSGRTDAGVHALGQVAHFQAELLNPHKLMGSLNGLLPYDIRILGIEEALADFHARYSAKGKIYRYHLFLDRIMNPFRRLYTWHIRSAFCKNSLREAAELFLGEHDFTTFANEAHSGVAAIDPIRTLKRLDIIPEEGGVCLEFEADGFLYKMVRNIVGTLVETALGKRNPSTIPYLLAKRDRKEAGIAAPPQGLFLFKVLYPDPQENGISELLLPKNL